MPHGIIQRMEGREGSQRIPMLNAVVAIFSSWSLNRRAAKDGDGYDAEGLWDLRAPLSYKGPLIEDQDYPDRVTYITVDLRTGKRYKVVQDPGFRTVIQGHTLLMEGVRLERADD